MLTCREKCRMPVGGDGDAGSRRNRCGRDFPSKAALLKRMTIVLGKVEEVNLLSRLVHTASPGSFQAIWRATLDDLGVVSRASKPSQVKNPATSLATCTTRYVQIPEIGGLVFVSRLRAARRYKEITGWDVHWV